MKKSPQPKLEPLKIYMNAERFRLADIQLRSTSLEVLNVVGGPALVLSAFASELYFKCLIVIETGRCNITHNLKALFRDLSKTSRTRIEKLWNERPLQASTLNAITKVTGRPPPTDLSSALDEGANAFVQLRYLHERDQLKMSFIMGDLPDIIRTVILEKKPEWAEVRHAPPTFLPR